MINKIKSGHASKIMFFWLLSWIIPPVRNIVYSYALLSLPMILVLIYLIKNKEMISLKITLKDLGLILLVYVITSAANILLHSLMPVTPSANQTGLEQQISGIGGWMVAIYVLVYAPFMEEIIFRGVIQETFQKQFKKVIGVILASLVFALPHMIADIAQNGLYNVDWYKMAPYLISGLGFGFIYAKTNKLSTSIWLHFLNNGIALMAVFIK